jgi:hypothetical protein
MNLRKIAVLACLFIVALVFSCRNESVLNPSQERAVQEQDRTEMPSSFRTGKFEKYLQEKFNDTLQIQWVPDWAHGTYQKVNDNIAYSHVELVPIFFNTRKKIKILKSKVTYKKYLIFTSLKTGEGPTYIAKYFPHDTKEKNIDMKIFTGQMLLHNLDADTWSVSELEKGVKKKGKGEKSARTSVTCYFTECTWWSENCLGVFVSATFGQNMCPYPTSENCYGEIWQKNSQTTFTMDCADDPTGPGGTGNGGFLEFNSLYHIQAPSNQISNLGNRLACFKNWRTRQPGHTYENKLTIYIDQPVNGTDQLFRTGTLGPRQAGHVYLGVEQKDTYNGASTTTRIVLGFYPYQEKWAVTGTTIAGTWGDDGGSPYDYSLSVGVNAEHFDSLLDNLIDNQSTTYNLQTNNCATMAWWMSNDAFSILGGVPSGEQNIGPFGQGKTPAKMGQEVEAKFGNNPNFQRSNGADSPQTQGCN